MLVRSDPFRDLDRFTQQVLGTAARPAVMPMDAWREGEEFVVEFDLPGIDEKSLDLDIERLEHPDAEAETFLHRWLTETDRTTSSGA